MLSDLDPANGCWNLRTCSEQGIYRLRDLSEMAASALKYGWGIVCLRELSVVLRPFRWICFLREAGIVVLDAVMAGKVVR